MQWVGRRLWRRRPLCQANRGSTWARVMFNLVGPGPDCPRPGPRISGHDGSPPSAGWISTVCGFRRRASAAHWRHAAAIFSSVSRFSTGPDFAIRSHSSAYLRYSEGFCIFHRSLLISICGSQRGAQMESSTLLAPPGNRSRLTPLSTVRFWVKGLLMPKGDEYRRHAAECVLLAQQLILTPPRRRRCSKWQRSGANWPTKSTRGRASLRSATPPPN
jgi:hypothetical protein